MNIKKILLISALTFGLSATTVNAQEQTNENKEAQDVVNTVAGENPAMTMTKATGPAGMWIRRKKGHQVKVEFRDGAMYCTIINRTKRNGKPKKDFEMCHGMMAEGDAWKGKKMKHPEMPGFMKFKGTVTVDGDVLKIKGCAGICDSEEWDRMPPAG